MRLFITLMSLLLLIGGCTSNRNQEENPVLHVIHAGSLSLPVKKIVDAYQQQHPGTEILTEAWGSKAGARRIMEINTPADVFLSADYQVINQMLIPDHASWYLPFASNEMAIVYSHDSRYASEINQQNWHQILLRQDVNIGRSNPDHDPCGIRAVLTCKLAAIFYEQEQLDRQLLTKDLDNIRPKETDLIALLENGHLDYIFLYRSVAQQHNLPYLQLPAELNLADPSLHEWYAQVQAATLGAHPQDTIVETGQPMIYGATIPHKSKHPELAASFIAFLLSDKGIAIMESMGQPAVPLRPNPYYRQLPDLLKPFALEQ
ncbi:MAG: extracellular solute-binding protein [Bacteroidales bacterium]